MGNLGCTIWTVDDAKSAGGPIPQYDPEMPFVFRYSSGDKPVARFRSASVAQEFAGNYAYGHIVDTTPMPALPTERGVWVLGEHDASKISDLMVHVRDGWFRVINTDATKFPMSDAEVRRYLKTANKLNN